MSDEKIEETPSGCVILKKKEYEDLLSKVRSSEIQARERTIIIEWRGVARRAITDIAHELSVRSYDQINLSEGITTQIGRIATLIRGVSAAMFRKQLENVEAQYKLRSEELISNFEKLTPYERLFFKSEYLKKK